MSIHTSFSDAQKAALAAPLDPAVVAQREQAGQKFSYIEGWHAIAEANRIFGFDGWAREMIALRQLGEPREVGDKWRVEYSAHVRVTIGDVIRDGCGFGQGIDKDVGQAHESALKEAETDAMKRALMTFGNPFGLALYDKTKANVQAPPVEYISDDQRDQIQVLCDAAGVPSLRVCEKEKIANLKQLPAARFDAVTKKLRLTINQNAAKKEAA